MLRKEIVLKNCISKHTGYPYVGLSKDNETKSHFIHRLIAEAFIPNPDNLPCVNHIDQNRKNSVLSNLEWCTYAYNNSYGDANEKRRQTRRKNMEGKHKTIYQFDLDGNLLNVYTCGVEQLEKKLGYEMKYGLSEKSKTAHGFVFSYSPKFEYVEDIPKRHQKYVILLDKDGNEQHRFKSVSEAAEACGFDRHLFSRTKPIDGIITIKGLRFKVEQKENEYIPKGHKGPRPDLKGKGVKPVCQYTKQGEFVAEFPSISAAGESVGRNKGDIINCCKGKLKTAHGFIWRYKGDNPPEPLKDDSKRRINQYTLDGEYVATFDSIKNAVTALGKGVPTCISNALSGRTNSAYGYIWKYANT